MSVHRRNNQYTQHNIVVTIRNIFTFLLLANRKSVVTKVEVIYDKRYTTTMWQWQWQCGSGSLSYWFFLGDANMFGYVRGHPSRRRHREGLRRPPARSRPWRRERRNQQMVESTRAVRRRTGGQRRRWVVLWPAAAARRAFFIGGVWSAASAASDRMRALKQRTRWTGVFFRFYRGHPLHLWSLLGR